MARQLRHRGKLEEDERRLVRNLVKLAKWQERTLLVQGRKEAREAWAEACEEMHASGGRGAHRFTKWLTSRLTYPCSRDEMQSPLQQRVAFLWAHRRLPLPPLPLH